MIFHDNDLPVSITLQKIDGLEKAAKASPDQRARYLLHRDHNDALQEMVICITCKAYIMPHIQISRVKSYTLLRGNIGVIFFDPFGNPKKTFRMGKGKDEILLLRFNTDQWHSVVSEADSSVYIETAQGPFEGSLWANWAPASSITEEAVAYLAKMKTMVFG
jgi:cupin fold WbuC family metalloprotein